MEEIWGEMIQMQKAMILLGATSFLVFYILLLKYPLPSMISIVIALETTSREAKSLAFGAYLSMNRSPREFLSIPPSPRHPSVIKHPAP